MTRRGKIRRRRSQRTREKNRLDLSSLWSESRSDDFFFSNFTAERSRNACVYTWPGSELTQFSLSFFVFLWLLFLFYAYNLFKMPLSFSLYFQLSEPLKHPETNALSNVGKKILGESSWSRHNQGNYIWLILPIFGGIQSHANQTGYLIGLVFLFHLNLLYIFISL